LDSFSLGLNNMNKIFFVTGNQFKFDLAKSKLNLKDNIDLQQKKFNCPEIQADTIKEIASFSVKYCADNLKVPCIKNDSGMQVQFLNNFPGPYSKYIEKTITEKGILNLMSDCSNREATFIEALAFCEPGKEPVVFECTTRGKIANQSRGDNGWGFDKIFIPRGFDKTFAEFNDDDRVKLWGSSGYEELSRYLNNLYND